MSWDRPTAAAAMVQLLTDASAGEVSVFDKPPATFNVPAYICEYPATVSKHVPTFAIDIATWPILVAVGLDNGDDLDTLLDIACRIIEANPDLGGAVQSCKPTEYRSYRAMNVGGADYLTAELLTETRM